MGIVVGVDVGSHAARAVALDRDGAVVGHAAAPYPPTPGDAAGRADPESWRAAVEASLSVLASSVRGARAPDALAVGGQSPTTVPLGGGRAVTYRFPAGVDEGPVRQQAAQRALVESEGAGAGVCQLWDYVLVLLGAARVQGRWPGTASLDGFGDRHDTGSVVGAASGGWGVAAGTPLVAGAPDGLLTFWAAGLDEPGRGCDPGGQSGGLMVAAPAATTGGEPGLMRIPSPAKDGFMVGGPTSAHGLALEWLAGVTGRPVPDLLRLAESVPAGAGGVLFLPYLEGERAPRWNRALRGELVGLDSSSGPGELARAVLEGAAYGLGHVARRLRCAGVGLSAVTCTGSPSRSRLWTEIKASVLGVCMHVPEFTELSAYGAALAAGAGAGFWPAPGTAVSGSWPRPGMSAVEPSAAESELYCSLLDRFVELGDAAERRVERWQVV